MIRRNFIKALGAIAALPLVGKALPQWKAIPPPYKLSTQEIALLSGQTDETLIQWWLDLNGWRWPAALGPEELPDWKKQSDGLFHTEIYKRTAVMDWIVARVGYKRILRVHNSRMSDAEYELNWQQWQQGPFNHLYA